MTTMAPSKETILLIIGDEPSRLSIEKSLSESGYEVLTALNDSEAGELLHRTSPSLVVVERAARNVAKLRNHKVLRSAPIVALEDPRTKCAEDDCIDDLEQGADLVLCNQGTRELVARVRAILRRKGAQSQQAVRRVVGGVEMDLDRHEVKVNGTLVELTPKEFQILQHFMESPSRVFSRQEMLNCVWGEGYALDVHIHSLRQKIEADPSKPKLIVTVRGVGYKLRPGH